MRETNIQSITAYRCRVCRKYTEDDLLTATEKHPQPLDLQRLLDAFFEYIKSCKVDGATKKAIFLESPPQKAQISNNTITRISISPNAGRALENFSVVNVRSSRLEKYDGTKHSAVYLHNVFFYLGKHSNVFVFHRYGQSGCKTVFLNMFNEYLSEFGLTAHLDVLLSNEMFESSKRYIPEKLSLITTYSDIGSDIADNLLPKSRKRTEQETIIYLKAPRAKNIMEWVRNISSKQPTLDELKAVLVKDNYPVDFEDAKVTIKFGKVSRRVSLTEFSGMIGEYDITDRLAAGPDGTISVESLTEISDEYALSFFEEIQE